MLARTLPVSILELDCVVVPVCVATPQTRETASDGQRAGAGDRSWKKVAAESARPPLEIVPPPKPRMMLLLRLLSMAANPAVTSLPPFRGHGAAAEPVDVSAADMQEGECALGNRGSAPVGVGVGQNEIAGTGLHERTASPDRAAPGHLTTGPYEEAATDRHRDGASDGGRAHTADRAVVQVDTRCPYRKPNTADGRLRIG